MFTQSLPRIKRSDTRQGSSSWRGNAYGLDPLDDLVHHGTLVDIPSTLLPGDKIKYKGICYTVTGITSWRDPVHGRVYTFDLEAEGGTRSMSMVEGARVDKM